ncbi:MAG: UvrD-helicase domain-containing protein, partial [Pseudanabaenaceae cyanobacterium]
MVERYTQTQQKSKFMRELRCLLEQYKFEDAKKFYEDQYSKFIIISPEEYLREHNIYYARFRESQKSALMIELRHFLEQYRFEDAKKFYENQCTKFITSDEYKREDIQYLKRFRESRRSDLMIELRNFLEQHQFENAKNFYQEQCTEIITLEEYQREYEIYLNQFRNLQKSDLMSRLEYLFERYQFEDAESFYQSQCTGIITLGEYQGERNFYLRRLCNLYKSRLEIVIRENFLDADKVYQEQYKSYINIEEYNDIKQNFIQSWTEANIKDKPDLEQSLAIGSANSHVQLIARAGSGKTSTLVNRAIFLQRHCGIKSSEILLLAFNRKAAQEIRERLQNHLQNDLPYAMTFHALAYHLVHPDETLIFDELDGQQSRSRSLQSVIDEHIRNPDYSEHIKSLMMGKFRDVWIRISEGGYNLTPEEMIEYRRSLPQIGIDGYNYKSGGEKIIADFLFEHDIPFKYEKNFWWSGINYHPDFTILKEVNEKKGIVIEYFGLEGDPNYDEQSEQKRRYWQEEQSEYFFVELNPKIIRQYGRKGMENHLCDILIDMGLEFNLLSTSEIWEKIKDRAIDRFTKAMTNFIGRCRKQCLSPNQLSEKIERYFASNPKTTEIEFQFLDLAQNFYISYLDRLQQTGEEDFDGLMQRAAKTVDEGNTVFLSSRVRGDLKELKYI